MRTVSAACAMADAPRTEAAAIVARMWRRVMLMVTFPFTFFCLVCSSDEGSDGAAAPGSGGSCELDEAHGRQKVLRERGNRRVSIALERGPDDRGVFGFHIAGFFAVAPDRE